MAFWEDAKGDGWLALPIPQKKYWTFESISCIA
jgi:hypothetical protein